jgi:predicted O-linked N-acetylglucosamine transferase (SPINDLY family)
LAQHDYAGAISLYQKAIAIDDAHPQWHGNLGSAYAALGDLNRAASCYQNGLDLEPLNLDLNIRLATALRSLGKYAASIKLLEKTLSIDPNHPEALANLVIAYEQTCHWDRLDPLYRRLDRSTKQALTRGDLPAEDPMLNIRRSQDLAINRAVSQAWSQTIKTNALRLAAPFTHTPRRRSDNRITIGYLSHDFRDHPVAHQIFPLFHLHDRSRFKVIAFSMGPDDGSVFRKAVQDHCDKFIDISTCGLVDAAQTIYRHKVDILIDLMGHSHHNRMAILALRPAPLQVGYLGFLSTTGADFIDYLVADDVVIAPDHSDFYSEQIIRMPACYQINHSRLIDSIPGSRRKDWHLPTEAFVFCCFNVAYKIDRTLFSAWMRILKKSPKSVLWLYGSNHTAIDHMQAEAEASGVDPNRLVFAEKLPLEEHLRRLPLADLALDTLRYNGGATTANALSVGLPVLTAIGNHWVSRMSASHLTAAGLDQLAAPDLTAYEIKAVALARNPQQLHTLRRQLSRHIKSYPLFDPGAFVRSVESGYESIWERYINGKAPQSIVIPSLAENHDMDRHSSTHCELEPASEKIASGQSDVGSPSKMSGKASNMCRIYYCCPDTHERSAGIRRLYRHVSLLHDAGYPACMLHTSNGFKRHDMPHVPLEYLEQVDPDMDAIFVIPEGMPKIMYRLKDHSGRRFVIALNWHNIFSTLPDGMDWRHLKIERVLAVSPVVGRMVSWSMDLQVHMLNSSIDHQCYFHDPNLKRPQLSFISRKAFNIDRLRRMLGAKNPDYINNINWVGLDGLSEDDYAAQIRQSSLFVTTSMAEGFPTSCLEAMAAGTIVAGYAAGGGNDILVGAGPSQNCILAPNGDYVSLAYGLEPALKDLTRGKMSNWAPIVENGKKTTATMTMEYEQASLVSFWSQFSSTERVNQT